MGHELTADRLDTCVIKDRAAAERYVAKVCFKTGPPTRIGIELEWIVYHRDDPGHPIEPAVLATALGDHAPRTLHHESPALPLPQGSVVTVEPGGQVELSTPPHDSPAALFRAVLADQARLTAELAAAGLVLGDEARDAHRPGHVARRMLQTPRYAAMERAYDRHGPHGRAMMCRTAGLQICLDIGTAERAGPRWRAAHAIGPALLAAFANSPGHGGSVGHGGSAGHAGPGGHGGSAGHGGSGPRGAFGGHGALAGHDAHDPPGDQPDRLDRDHGRRPRAEARSQGGPDAWASERMRTWFGLDPALRHAPPFGSDAAAGWARRALDAPLLVLRRDGSDWTAPPGVSFADWIGGALPLAPTYDDLDYHLSTLFPLVRPRGYLELRYLDTQPGTAWQVPAALVAALFADEGTVDAALDITAATADRWVPAARDGLADPALRRTATALFDLACRALPGTGLPSGTVAAVTAAADRIVQLGVSR